MILTYLWSDDIDTETIEVFQNTLEVLIKKVVHFDQLEHWKKTDVNRRLLIDFLKPVN